MRPALLSSTSLLLLVVLISCAAPSPGGGDLETKVAELETQLAQAETAPTTPAPLSEAATSPVLPVASNTPTLMPTATDTSVPANTPTPQPPTPTSPPAPSPTPVPPTPTPTPLPRDAVIYFDDFSNPNSGFFQVAREGQRCEYVDGRYRIYLDHTTSKVEHESLTVGDFILDVDATQVAGATSGTQFGVAVRIQGPDDSYGFKISSDGTFLVERKSLARGNMRLDYGNAPSVRPVGQSNHLTVLCRGQDMHFYVNGYLVSTVQDDVFGSGRIAIRGNASDAQIDVSFDNLYVYALG